MRKMFIDFDGVMVDHLDRVVQLYNKDCSNIHGFSSIRAEDIKTYNMTEMKYKTLDERLAYFEDERFFDKLPLMDGLDEAIVNLYKSGLYTFSIVTMGTAHNLKLKAPYIENSMRDLGVPVELILLDTSQYSNKSCIDMSGGIFLDDLGSNLETSNAKTKIVFGKRKPWNEEFRGIRLLDWYDVESYFGLI